MDGEDIVGKPMDVSDFVQMLIRMQKRMESGDTFTDASIPEVVQNLYGEEIDRIKES